MPIQMKRLKTINLFFILFLTVVFGFSQDRATAYPLLNHDTYFSLWSLGDELSKSSTKYWTGKDHSILGILKVDDKYYRFHGKSESSYKTLIERLA